MCIKNLYFDLFLEKNKGAVSTCKEGILCSPKDEFDMLQFCSICKRII